LSAVKWESACLVGRVDLSNHPSTRSFTHAGGRTLERDQRSSWPGWKRLSPFAVWKDSSTAHRRPTTRTSSRSGTTSGE
jgi:hypothetical protein